MYITRVRVTGIKGFSGARAVDLNLTRPDGTYAGWTVLAGQNGSGKSTLLKALALVISGPDLASALMSDYENWVTTGESEARVAIGFRAGSTDIWTADTDEQHPPADAVSEGTLGLVWRASDSERAPRTGGRPAQPTLHVDPFTTPDAKRGPWQQNPYGWFSAGYGPFRRLIGDIDDRQRLMRRSLLVSRLASLFYEDMPLTDGVGWLIEQHLRALEERAGAAELKAAALQILGDGLLPDNFIVSDVDSEGLWVIKDSDRFPLRVMGDGYRTVTALVVDLLKRIHEMSDELPFEITSEGIPRILTSGVVVIDEIDAHLHPSWQKRIGSWLKTHFPNIQFIVTTHSPYVCQSADPRGLIRLPGPDEQSPPQIVPQDLWERVVYGSGDDAVVSELFGVDTTYSEEAQRLRRRLVILEVKVIKGVADTAEISEYQGLKEKLTSSAVARSQEIAASLGLLGAADT